MSYELSNNPINLPKIIKNTMIDKMFEYYENPAKDLEDNDMEDTFKNIIILMESGRLEVINVEITDDINRNIRTNLYTDDPVLNLLYEKRYNASIDMIYIKKHINLIEYMIIIRIMTLHAKDLLNTTKKYEALSLNLRQLQQYKIIRIFLALATGALTGIITFYYTDKTLKKSGTSPYIGFGIDIIVSFIATSFVYLKMLDLTKVSEKEKTELKEQEQILSDDVKKDLEIMDRVSIHIPIHINGGSPIVDELLRAAEATEATEIPPEFKNDFYDTIKMLKEINKNPSIPIKTSVMEKYLKKLLELIKNDNLQENIDIKPIDPKTIELLNLHASSFNSIPLMKEIDEIREDPNYRKYVNLLDFMRLSILAVNIEKNGGGYWIDDAENMEKTAKTYEIAGMIFIIILNAIGFVLLNSFIHKKIEEREFSWKFADVISNLISFSIILSIMLITSIGGISMIEKFITDDIRENISNERTLITFTNKCSQTKEEHLSRWAEYIKEEENDSNSKDESVEPEGPKVEDAMYGGGSPIVDVLELPKTEIIYIIFGLCCLAFVIILLLVLILHIIYNNDGGRLSNLYSR